MSDAALDSESLLEDGADLPDEHEGETEHHDDKPAPRGYMTKEAWVESGKDPKEWVSEEVFKERGERIKQTSKLQKDFENQLKNVNLLHQIQLKNQREQLLAKRDDAIDVADKDGVKALDKQIAELDKLESLAKDQEPQPVKPPEVAKWESDNPWCNDPADPRLAIANRVYIAAINAGSDPAEALDLVDTAIAKKFSTKPTTQRQSVEGSRPSVGRGDAVLTMKNVTREERIAWDEGFFKTEKDFLQAVANSRKGAK